LLYPAVMSCAQQWYADRKGFATGVIGGAVGLSGAVLTLAGRFLIRNWDVRTAFWVLGAGMALVCGAACLVLENPQGGGAQTPAPGKADQSKAQNTPKYSGVPPVQKKQAASDNPTRQTAKSASPEKEKQPPRTFTTPQMLKTPQYWLLTAAVCCSAPLLWSLARRAACRRRRRCHAWWSGRCFPPQGGCSCRGAAIKSGGAARI
ncbi:MAG: MFS transporter, partial [Ruthenibacterium sp.]